MPHILVVVSPLCPTTLAAASYIATAKVNHSDLELDPDGHAAASDRSILLGPESDDVDGAATLSQP